MDFNKRSFMNSKFRCYTLLKNGKSFFITKSYVDSNSFIYHEQSV